MYLTLEPLVGMQCCIFQIPVADWWCVVRWTEPSDGMPDGDEGLGLDATMTVLARHLLIIQLWSTGQRFGLNINQYDAVTRSSRSVWGDSYTAGVSYYAVLAS